MLNNLNVNGYVLLGASTRDSTVVKCSMLLQGPPSFLLMDQSVQFNSVTQSCPTLCDTMDCSLPGFPVHHQLPELAQTHVHQVGDAILPSHPLLPPSPPAFSLSQHQGLFQRVSSLHRVAKVLEFQLQHQFFQWTLRTDFRQDWLVGSPCGPMDFQESGSTSQFKSIYSLALSFPTQYSSIWIYKAKLTEFKGEIN